MLVRRLRIPIAVAIPVGVLVVLLAPHHMDLPITWASAPWLAGRAAAGGTPLWWALEDIANVGLFVPLGVLLARAVGPVPAVLVGGTISAVCEFAQQWIPTRHASLLDVAMNMIGTAVGVLLAVLLSTRRSAEPRLPARRALPVDPAVIRLRRLHLMEAERAVGHVESALVHGSSRGWQRPVADASIVPHGSMVTLPADAVLEDAP